MKSWSIFHRLLAAGIAVTVLIGALALLFDHPGGIGG